MEYGLTILRGVDGNPFEVQVGGFPVAWIRQRKAGWAVMVCLVAQESKAKRLGSFHLRLSTAIDAMLDHCFATMKRGEYR